MAQGINDGGSAFPRAPHYRRGGNTQCFYEGHYGMSLRDYFAAAVISGLDWRGVDFKHQRETESLPDLWARKAYELADAMLKAREKQS